MSKEGLEVQKNYPLNKKVKEFFLELGLCKPTGIMNDK